MASKMSSGLAHGMMVTMRHVSVRAGCPGGWGWYQVICVESEQAATGLHPGAGATGVRPQSWPLAP